MLVSLGKELGALVTDGLAFSKTELMKRTSRQIDPAAEGDLQNDLTEKLVPAARSQHETNKEVVMTDDPTDGNATVPLTATVDTSVPSTHDNGSLDDSSDGDSLVE